MKGATFRLYPTKLKPINFNPRPREGSDLLPALKLPASQKISIHAPVKGATFVQSPIVHFGNYFNPRPREGSDGAIRFEHICFGISIHAPVKGATPHKPSFSEIVGFQSTPP